MTKDTHCPPVGAAGSSASPIALAALMTIGLLSPAAQAANVCTGTLSASPLRTVAKPYVVALEHPIDSTANPGLAKAFLDGVQSAGPTVVPKGRGTTDLDLSFLMRSAKGKPGTYKTLSWLRSEPAPKGIQSMLRGSHVDVTIYARDASSHALAWTATISCTIQTDDPTELAQGLGKIVGQSFGQTLPKVTL
ncbi:MAG TPA: hypothetical protein VFG62_18665 [Rhodopila sp.]|nr:hypothetical protein [Rhodopila sp.]